MKLTSFLVPFAAILSIGECGSNGHKFKADIYKRATTAAAATDAGATAGALSAIAILGQLGASDLGGGAATTAPAAPAATTAVAGGGAGTATGTALGGGYSYNWAAASSLQLDSGIPAASAAVTTAAGAGYGTATALATNTPTATSSSSSSGIFGSLTGIFGSLLGSIDFESIAGYIEELLTSGNNIQYLDNILIWLKDSNLLPEAVDLLLALNFSSPIIGEVVSGALSYVGTLNTTTFFIALDQSGLAYSVIADAIEDSATIPGVYAIISDVIASGGISISEILSAVGRLVKRDQMGGINEDGSINLEYITVRELAQIQYQDAQQRQQEAVSKRDLEYSSFFHDASDEELYILGFDKRDNIEDLLTTIMGSIERSGLINATLHTLLSDPAFQTSAASLISGALQSFASGTGNPTSLSFLGPVISGLVQSGLLGNTFQRAINDPVLRAAIINDIGGLLSSGTATLSNFYSGKEIDLYYKQLADKAANSTSVATLSTVTSGAASITSAAATATSATAASSSKASGNIVTTNLLAVFAGLSGYIMFT